jgi:hypothetical protein
MAFRVHFMMQKCHLSTQFPAAFKVLARGIDHFFFGIAPQMAG